MAQDINSSNYNEIVVQNEKPVLIDFWAAWCGPCRMVAPTIDKLAEDYKDTVVVGKVNVDEELELAEQFRIMSIPSLYLLKNGDIVERLIGLRSYKELSAMLEKHI